MALRVNVFPNADEDKVIRFDRGGLDVRLTKARAGGTTNDYLEVFLSRILDYPEKHIKVISGFEGTDKKVFIRGLNENELIDRLDHPVFKSSIDLREESRGGKDKSKKRSIKSKKKKRAKKD